MKLRITLLTAATLTAFSFAAHAAEKGTIMIMVNSLDNPYYASEAKGASEKAQALGYKTTVLSHGEDVKKQNELIDTAIGKKVQGIILDNADSTASVAAVEKAKKAGIPVVLINREIPVDDVALEQITHNNFQAGSEVANVFVEKMAEKGKYAELTCNLADNNCVTRSKSFHQVIDQYPDMVSVARQDAKGTLIDGEVFVNCQYGYDIQCEVVGETGIARLPEPSAVQMRKSASLSTAILTDWKDRFIKAYDVELQAFINDVKAGQLHGPSAWDGYAASVAAGACIKAQGTSEPVEVTLPEWPAFYKR